VAPGTFSSTSGSRGDPVGRALHRGPGAFRFSALVVSSDAAHSPSEASGSRSRGAINVPKGPIRTLVICGHGGTFLQWTSATSSDRRVVPGSFPKPRQVGASGTLGPKKGPAPRAGGGSGRGSRGAALSRTPLRRGRGIGGGGLSDATNTGPYGTKARCSEALGDRCNGRFGSRSA